MNKTKKNIGPRRILENIFFQSLSGMASKIGSLIFTILVARILFPKMFGIYSLALTIIIILVSISDMGLGGSITLFVAESLGDKKRKQARSRFWFLVRVKLIVSFIFSVGLFVCAGLIAALFKKPDLVIPLKIGSLYLLANSVYGVINPIFLSVQRLKYTSIVESVSQLSRIALIIFFFFILKLEANVQFIFILMIFSTLASAVLAIMVITKKYSFLIFGKKEPVERRRMIKFSTVISMSALGILLFANIDKLMLGFYLEAEFVGFYSAIITIVSGVIGILAISTVFFPIFIQLNEKRLVDAFKKSFHYVSLITFPSVIGLAFVIIPLLRVLYGVEYVPPQYETVLIITAVLLSLLILETIFSGFYKVLFDAKEKPSVPAYINIATSIVNIFLNLILISSLIKIDLALGMVGAAFATFISRFGGLIALAIFSKKRLNISPKKASITKPFLASLLMLGYLFLFSRLISLNILTGAVMIISAGIFYLIVIILIKGVNIQELINLRN